MLKTELLKNNFKAFLIHLTVVIIGWNLSWIVSSHVMMIFAFSTIGIYLVGAMLFIKPTSKFNFLSVSGVLFLLLLNAIFDTLDPNNLLAPITVNPANWCFEYSLWTPTINALETTTDMLHIILAFVPSLFMYLGILIHKYYLKRKQK